MRGVCLIFLFVLITACESDKCRPTPDGDLIPVNIEVDRAESRLFGLRSQEEVREFLKEEQALAYQLLHANEYPDLNILAERMFGLIQDPFIDTLYNESIESFDQDLFESQMNEAISLLKYYVPQAEVPKVQTIVSGLYNDMVVSRNQVIVGLDFFVGDSASYRPTEIPQYILRRYNQSYLVPTILKFLVSDYASSGDEETLLSEMIDYGKVYYLLGRIMPCTPDDLILGYTSQEIVDVYAYQELIWARLIEQEVLYVTDEFTKKKFVGERPKTFELGDECPGRIGHWLGWQIVKHYMDQTGASIDQLMANRNHHEIFSVSGYKPRNVR